jgi:hypothetical protein
MKLGKTVKWMFLFTICNLSAQNNYSFDFVVNTQPTENIKINEVSFGADYSKTFDSKFRIENKLVFNSKNINYFNSDYSISESEFNLVSNRFVFCYLKSKKTSFNFEIEPFVASENNLKWDDIDFFGGVNVEFILSSNKKLMFGFNRNAILGKPMILPVFAYDYQYSNDLNFRIGFPETNIKFSNNPRNMFCIKSVFDGSNYNLDKEDKVFSLNSDKASFSQLTTSFEYERNMNTNWFVNFKMGYDFNRKYLLQDSNYNTTFDFNIKNGCNLGLTIKYKH